MSFHAGRGYSHLNVFECWRSHPPGDPSPPAAPSSPVCRPGVAQEPHTGLRDPSLGVSNLDGGNFLPTFPKHSTLSNPDRRNRAPATGPCLAPVCVNKVLLEHSQGHSFTCRQSCSCTRRQSLARDGRALHAAAAQTDRTASPSGSSRKVHWPRSERCYTGRACSGHPEHGALGPGPGAVQTPHDLEVRPGHGQQAQAPRPPPAGSAHLLLQRVLDFGVRLSLPVEQELASVNSASSLYRPWTLHQHF